MSLAIATTSSRVNIAALARSAIGFDWKYTFQIIEGASTAARKKPHPQVSLQALQRMGLDAADYLAFEDSAAGLRAAGRAGLPTIATPKAFPENHDFTGPRRVLPGLEGATVVELCAWYAAAAR